MILLLIAAIGLLSCHVVAPEPPSVILVVIDTLRRDHLGFHGYERDTSPGLDRLAHESAVFENCLAPSSWTRPSVASLLSGLYPPRHGIHRNKRAGADIEFIAETLQGHGYTTAAFSGNMHVSKTFGMHQGFDRFKGGDRFGADDYPDIQELLRDARAWLHANSKQPSFLYLHLMNVHGPYRAASRYGDRFRTESHRPFPFQNKLWKQIVGSGDLTQRDQVSDEHLNDLEARYDGAIAYTDEMLTAFLDALKDDGTLGSSLLIITSDHGEELFDHGGFGHKRTLHAEVVDVPLLIRDPDGSGAGQRIRTPVSLVDIPATILDRAGLLQSGGGFGDGRSLVPLMRSVTANAPRSERPLIAELDEATSGRAFLIQEWPLRLVLVEQEYTGRANSIDLFDLEADPGEQVDLSLTQRQRARELQARATKIRSELQRSGSAPQAVPIVGDLERRLEALGYVE
jgi:arylsulfatase A-like enzyme